MELSTLKFVVDTGQLDDAFNKIKAIGVEVGNLAKANSTLERSEKAKKKTTEEAGDAAVKAYEKQADGAVKAGEAVDKLINKQKDALDFMRNSFSSGQASVLAYAKSIGASVEQIQELANVLDQKRALIGGDAFDKSIGGLKLLQNELKLARQVTAAFNDENALSKNQLKELGRDIERITQLYTAQGKSAEFIKQAIGSLTYQHQKYSEALRDEEKVQKDLQAVANAEIAKQEAITNAIEATNYQLEKNKLLKSGYSNATAGAGATLAVAGVDGAQLKALLDARKANEDLNQSIREQSRLEAAAKKSVEQFGDSAVATYYKVKEAQSNASVKADELLSKVKAQAEYFNSGGISKSAINELRAYERALQDAGVAADKTTALVKEFTTAQQQISTGKSNTNLIEGIKSIFLGGGALQAVQQAVQVFKEFLGFLNTTQDELLNLKNRLRVLSDGTIDFNKEFQNLVGIANSSRVPLKDVSTLFSRLVPIMPTLGKGIKDAANVTDAFSKILLISGASSTEASSALLQFSQALGKGKLDGDEFRSVAEATPEFLRILEKQLGVTRGELYKMAEEGKLTAKVLTDVLSGSLTSLTERLAGLPVTTEQAFTILKNQFTAFIEQITSGYSNTRLLADVLLVLADGLKIVADEFKNTDAVVKKSADDFDGVALAIRLVGDAMAALIVFAANVGFVFKGAGREIGAFVAQVIAIPSAISNLSLDPLRAIVDGLDQDNKNAEVKLKQFEDKVLGLTDTLLSNRALRIAQEDQKAAEKQREVAETLANPFSDSTFSKLDKHLHTRENITKKYDDQLIEINRAQSNLLIQEEQRKNEALKIINSNASQVLKDKAQKSFDEAFTNQKKSEDKVTQLTVAAARERDKALKALEDKPKNLRAAVFSPGSDNTLSELEKAYNSEITLINKQEKSKSDLLKNALQNKLITQGEYSAKELAATIDTEDKLLSANKDYFEKYEKSYIEQSINAYQKYTKVVEQNSQLPIDKRQEANAKALEAVNQYLSNLTRGYEVAALKASNFVEAVDNTKIERQQKALQDLRGEIRKIEIEYDKYIKSEKDLQDTRSRSAIIDAELLLASPEQTARIKAEAEETDRYAKIISDWDEKLRLATLSKVAFDEVALTSGGISTELAQQIDEINKLIDKITEARDKIRSDATIGISKKGDAAVIQEQLKQEAELIKGLSGSIVTALFEGGKAGSKKLRDLMIAELKKPITIFVTAVLKEISGFGGNSSGGQSFVGSAFQSIVGQSAGSLAGSAFGSVAGFLGGTSGAVGAANITGALGGDAIGSLISGLGGAEAAVGTFGATVASAIPYIGAALLAYKALDSFFGSKGGPKTESGFGAGVTQRGDSSASMQVAVAIQSSVADLGKTLGVTIKDLQVGVFTAVDSVGSALTQLEVTATQNGAQIYNRVNRTGTAENVGRSPEALQAAIVEETNRVLLAALQNSDLSDKFKSYINTATDVSAAIQNVVAVNNLDKALSNLGSAFKNITGLSVDTELAFANLFGGIQGLTDKLASYYNNYYTAGERAANTTAQLRVEFNKLGLTLPSTREDFRALVDQQLALGESGRNTAAALLNLQEAFASTTAEVVTGLSYQEQRNKLLADEKTALEAVITAQERLKAAKSNLNDSLRALSDFQNTLKDNIKKTTDEMQKVRQAAIDAAQKVADDAQAAVVKATETNKNALKAFADYANGLVDKIASANSAIDNLRKTATAAVTSAISGVTSALTALKGKSEADANSVLSAEQKVASAREAIQSELQSANDKYVSAQKQVVDIQKQAAISLYNFAKSLKKFTDDLAVNDLGSQSAGDKKLAAKSIFQDTLQKATAGDSQAQSDLTNAASVFLQSVKDYGSSAQEYVAADIQVREALNALADSIPKANEADPLAAANDAVNEALGALQSIQAIANSANVTLVTTQKDLGADYRLAVSELNSATLDASKSALAYNEALSVAASYGVQLVDSQVTLNSLVGDFTKSIADLSSARDVATQVEADKLSADQSIVAQYSVLLGNLSALESEQQKALQDASNLGINLQDFANQSQDATSLMQAVISSQGELQAAQQASIVAQQGVVDAGTTLSQSYIDLSATLEDYNRQLEDFNNRTAGIDLSAIQQLDPLGDLLTKYSSAVTELQAATEGLIAAQTAATQATNNNSNFDKVTGLKLAQDYAKTVTLDAYNQYISTGTPLDAAGGTTADQVNAIYRELLGRNAEGGIATAIAGMVDAGNYANGLDSLRQEILSSVEALARSYGVDVQKQFLYNANALIGTGVSNSTIDSLFQGFASGGSFGGGYRMVGENGPELEATGPSRIYNATQTRSILQGNSNEGLVKKIDELIEAVNGMSENNSAENIATFDQIQKMSKIIQRADNGDSLRTLVVTS